MSSCRRWPAIRAGPEAPAGVDDRPTAAATELGEVPRLCIVRCNALDSDRPSSTVPRQPPSHAAGRRSGSANGGPTALRRFPLTARHHDIATANHRTTVPAVMAAALMSLAKHGSIWFDLHRTKKRTVGSHQLPPVPETDSDPASGPDRNVRSRLGRRQDSLLMDHNTPFSSRKGMVVLRPSVGPLELARGRGASR